MNIFESKGAIRLLIIIRPVLLALIAIGIFFYYNSFLIDHTLETLKFFLSTMASAETADSVSYLAPLMQIQFIDGLSTAEFNAEELMRLQYSADVIGTAHPERKVADVVSVMQEAINKREKERNIVLRFLDKVNSYLLVLYKGPEPLKKEIKRPYLDPAVLEEINNYENRGQYSEAIRLYRVSLANFFNYAQTPGLFLRLGYLLHKLGRFEEARIVYEAAICGFPGRAEAKVAEGLLAKIKERAELDKDAKALTLEITRAGDKESRQKLHYQLGRLELSVLNLQKAREHFRRAASILPEADIAAQSYLRLGICEKLLGNLDASVEVFKKAAEITRDAELKTQSEYQLAQIRRQKGEYQEAASILDDIAKEQADRDIKSLLLFQKGATFLYDEKDIAKARQVFDELMRRYSAQALVSPGSEASFVDFVKKHVNLDILARKPEELEKILEKAWVEALLPKKILKIIEANSNRIINYLNQTVIGIAKLKEQALKEEAYVQIELTEDKVNNLIRGAVGAAGSIDISDISIGFEGEQKLTVSGEIRRRERPIKVFISGELKMVNLAEGPFWESAALRKNLLVFLVEECRIANIPVSPDIMNSLFGPAFENFNESFPLDIEKFKLDEETIVFAGPLKADFIEKLREAPVTGRIASEEEVSGILRDAAVKKVEKDNI